MKRRYPLSRKRLRFSVMARSRHLAEVQQTSEPMNKSLSYAAGDKALSREGNSRGEAVSERQRSQRTKKRFLVREILKSSQPTAAKAQRIMPTTPYQSRILSKTDR